MHQATGLRLTLGQPGAATLRSDVEARPSHRGRGSRPSPPALSSAALRTSAPRRLLDKVSCSSPGATTPCSPTRRSRCSRPRNTTAGTPRPSRSSRTGPTARSPTCPRARSRPTRPGWRCRDQLQPAARRRLPDQTHLRQGPRRPYAAASSMSPRAPPAIAAAISPSTCPKAGTASRNGPGQPVPGRDQAACRCGLTRPAQSPHPAARG